MASYYIGVDLGQMRDPSTIAVVERAELRGDWDGIQFAYRKVIEMRLRALERIPLGTPYPEVVGRVVQVADRLGVRGKVKLIVDGTGVGAPVVDLVRRAHPTGQMLAVKVTGGDRETSSDGYYYVPKRDLIVGLQVVFQNGELRIAEELEEGRTLARELAGMQVKVTPSGNEQFAAWREGEHDDLVFAVALACWGVKRANVYAESHWYYRYEAEAAEVFKKCEVFGKKR